MTKSSITLCGFIVVITVVAIFLNLKALPFDNHSIVLGNIEAQAKGEAEYGNLSELATNFCEDNKHEYLTCESSSDNTSSCYPMDETSCPPGMDEGDGLGGDPNCDHLFLFGRCTRCGMTMSGSSDSEDAKNKCPKGGYHEWYFLSKNTVKCTKCGKLANYY